MKTLITLLTVGEGVVMFNLKVSEKITPTIYGILISLIITALAFTAFAQVTVRQTEVIKYVRCDDTGLFFATKGLGLAYIGDTFPGGGVSVRSFCGFTYYKDPRTGICYASYNGGLARVPENKIMGGKRIHQTRESGSEAESNLRSQFGNFLK
jgi:hypothetical protein